MATGLGLVPLPAATSLGLDQWLFKPLLLQALAWCHVRCPVVMATGHGQEPRPLAIATGTAMSHGLSEALATAAGYGQVPWPLAMPWGHIGHGKWPYALANGFWPWPLAMPISHKSCLEKRQPYRISVPSKTQTTNENSTNIKQLMTSYFHDPTPRAWYQLAQAAHSTQEHQHHMSGLRVRVVLRRRVFMFESPVGERFASGV